MTNNISNNISNNKSSNKLLIALVIILYTVVVALTCYIVYNNINNNAAKEQKYAVSDTIMSLSTQGINQYIDKLSSNHIEQFIKYDKDNGDLNLGVNLFDKDIFDGNLVRNILVINYNDLEATDEYIAEEDFGYTNYYTKLDPFKDDYYKMWNEEVTADTHTINNDKVLCYVIGTGLGIPTVKIKAKSIIFDGSTGVYTLETNVGIFDVESDSEEGYEYDNNYVGKIKFTYKNDTLQFLSFVITEK